MSTTEYLKLTELSSNPSQPDVVINAILRELESRFHVKSRASGGPPGTPSNGDTYIVDTVTGAWSPFSAGDIVRYYSANWYGVTPAEGWRVWCDDEDALLSHDGSRWREAPIYVGNLQDFSQDEATTTGLTFGYRAGRVRNDSAVTSVSAGTIALTASSTNYIELTGAGTILANTSGFTSGRIPLFVAVTDGSGITSVADKRTWVSLGAASGGGSASLTDFDEDAGTTTGLTWGYQTGRIRRRNTVTSVSAGTVALTDSATNYVEIDSAGTVSANTSGFTVGKIPLRQVTTSGGSQTASTDMRAWLPLTVEGPTSATDNALARFDGATGRIIQNSGWTLGDDGTMDAGDTPLQQARHSDYSETLKIHGELTGNTTLNYSDGNHHRLNVGAAMTLSIGEPPGNGPLVAQMSVEVRWDGPYTFTMPTVEWDAGTTPTMSDTSGKEDEFIIKTRRGDDWPASTAVAKGKLITPTTWNGYIYECTTAGTTGASEPTWGTTPGGTTSDNGATWTCRKASRGYMTGQDFS